MRNTIIAAAIAGLFGFTATAQEKLAVKGSDTINAKLMPRLADAYKAAGNKVTFEIEDKGSSSAFTNLEAGTADIGASSRAVKDSEKEKFTAKGQEPDRRRAEALGVDAFVTKPFSNSDVVGQVNALLARAAPAEDAQPSRH